MPLAVSGVSRGEGGGRRGEKGEGRDSDDKARLKREEGERSWLNRITGNQKLTPGPKGREKVPFPQNRAEIGTVQHGGSNGIG